MSSQCCVGCSCLLLCCNIVNIEMGEKLFNLNDIRKDIQLFFSTLSPAPSYINALLLFSFLLWARVKPAAPPQKQASSLPSHWMPEHYDPFVDEPHQQSSYWVSPW